MRILHTSDWHIGRTFHGHRLLADQQQILGDIADLVTEHRVDVVVVAGDLYDRAVPSADAVQVATTALGRIRDAGAHIVVSSGNHDSAPRLGAFAEFLSAGGLHIGATIDALDRPVVLNDDHGPVAFYSIPYLEPEIAAHVMSLPRGQGHAGVLAEAMRRIRLNLSEQPSGMRSVVLAHAFVVGGKSSDSERAIDAREVIGTEVIGSDLALEGPSGHGAYGSDVASTGQDSGRTEGEKSGRVMHVGTVGSVSASVFDGVDYVALGHLHRPQEIAHNKRYSGSPLPYSFSEAGYAKSVWLVDLDAAGLNQVRALKLPVVRPLATVRGTLADVIAGYGDLIEHYLTVELTDEIRPTDPMRRLRERFPHTVRLEWLPGQMAVAELDFGQASRMIPDSDLIANFLLECRGSAPSSGEQDLVLQALTDLRIVEASQ
ncbi:exonuclease SbcCD subunit D [Nakamurella antarctica]|uniref:Nuclease SbcCD subunit D n=1 Tax=Nakamurella antarctica TaxID=1902245 RepID=A0A3G8ZLP1_9ACTN|nr:exonuclease SbcCD subunit D [Nakamurella antarctica]AZI58249.1 exonuclease SbcCD subunit D [Nakamurella antarctica]